MTTRGVVIALLVSALLLYGLMLALDRWGSTVGVVLVGIFVAVVFVLECAIDADLAREREERRR